MRSRIFVETLHSTHYLHSVTHLLPTSAVDRRPSGSVLASSCCRTHAKNDAGCDHVFKYSFLFFFWHPRCNLSNGCHLSDTGAEIQLNHLVLVFQGAPGAISPMGAILNTTTAAFLSQFPVCAYLSQFPVCALCPWLRAYNTD